MVTLGEGSMQMQAVSVAEVSASTVPAEGAWHDVHGMMFSLWARISLCGRGPTLRYIVHLPHECLFLAFGALMVLI